MNTRKVTIKLNLTHGSSGYAGFELHDVVINTEGRINFREVQQCEDGEFFSVTRWERIDGKTDKYRDIYQEALENGLNKTNN